MPIYIGTQKINVSGIDKVYVGSQLVYQAIAVLDHIVLSGQTTSLSRGSTFSFGGTVTAYYTNGTTANVTSNTTFSGYNMSTAGTYTVTASYTENGITKTATYKLTVTKAWSQIWSGNKSKTVSNSTGDAVNVYTSTLTGTQTLRVTYSSSGTGGVSGSVNLYRSNGSTTWSTTKPSSPVQISVAMGTTKASLISICRSKSSSAAGPVVSLNYNKDNKTFYLSGSQIGSSTNGSATLTITKIERYY